MRSFCLPDTEEGFEGPEVTEALNRSARGG